MNEIETLARKLCEKDERDPACPPGCSRQACANCVNKYKEEKK